MRANRDEMEDVQFVRKRSNLLRGAPIAKGLSSLKFEALLQPEFYLERCLFFHILLGNKNNHVRGWEVRKFPVRAFCDPPLALCRHSSHLRYGRSALHSFEKEASFRDSRTGKPSFFFCRSRLCADAPSTLENLCADSRAARAGK